MTGSEKPIPETFTPALGQHWLTPVYDLAIATLTRERIWRAFLVRQVQAVPGDRILDVGCGTGTLATLIASRTPQVAMFGIDPDPHVLERARRKVASAGASVDFAEDFLSEEVLARVAPLDKVVSSLVLHQVPLSEKARILQLMRRALRAGGEAHVADYGEQASSLMRWLFRRTVQRLDGMQNTQPNADGVLPKLMHEAGFRVVEETGRFATPTGSISVYRCIA